MSNKKLAVLGLAALLMVVWAVIQAGIANKPVASAGGVQAHLIQGLPPEKIARITVGVGDDAVTINRKGRSFLVVSKEGYPAKIKQINDLVTKVLDIKTTELITSLPENHDQLEVTEEKAHSVVKFFDKNGRFITGVVIGKQAEAGLSYIRPASANDVYLTADTPWIRDAALDYLDQQLFNFSEDNILSVTVTDPNGSYTLSSEPNSRDIVLENIPAGKQLSGADYKQVFSAITDMAFSDVMRASSVPGSVLFDTTHVCRLADSTVYTLKIARMDDKTWIKCRADFTDTAKITKAGKVESPEELKKKEAKLLARDAAKKFNDDHLGWTYQISDWKAENLTKSLDSLLEDIAKPDESDQTPLPDS